MRILLAEDDAAIRTVLKKRLEFSGYEVYAVDNGLAALDALGSQDFDILISDIMMPAMDGHELLKAVRAGKKDIPVLFLTAKDSSSDIVEGLDMGADDYMVKPFEFAELLARIRLLTRRRYGARENVYTVADLTVDAMTRKVTRGGKEIILSILQFLIIYAILFGNVIK